MFLNIKLIPRAKHNKIERINENNYKIHLTAPPVDNKANEALLDILAKNLRIRKSNLRIVKGEKTRNKVIEIIQFRN